MSFKILSQEEITVLNEHDKKVYEQSYQEYLERTAFVERLEQLDKVRLPKVSVKRKGIKKIKPPMIPAVKAQEFTADTAMGVNLLNVTKMVSRATDNNSRLSARINYRASLPNVLISAPDAVKTGKIAPFVITKTAYVPIATPFAAKYEIQKFSAGIPEIQRVMNPEFTETVIDDYSVNAIPSVKTELPSVPQVNTRLNYTVSLSFVKVAAPNVESVKIARSDAVELIPISVAKPAAIDTSIEDYKIPESVIDIVEAPIVAYVERDIQTVELSAVQIPDCPNIPFMIKDAMVEVPTVDSINIPDVAVKVGEAGITKELSAVPIPDCPNIPVVIKDAMVEIPTVDSISIPDVTVKVGEAEITKLKEVCIPLFAPEIHIEASTVSTINTFAISAPEEIHYSKPSYSVRSAPHPVISAPHIDTNDVLKTILSKIR